MKNQIKQKAQELVPSWYRHLTAIVILTLGMMAFMGAAF